MTEHEHSDSLRDMEGSMVEIRLADGSTLERCEVVSAQRDGGTIWICLDGLDAFLPASEVLGVAPSGTDN